MRGGNRVLTDLVFYRHPEMVDDEEMDEDSKEEEEQQPPLPIRSTSGSGKGVNGD